MEAVVLYRMELELVDDCHVVLAIVKLDVDDERCRSVGDSLEVPVADCEEDILHSLSIEVAGNETLPADRFDYGLVSDLADFAVKFKMLHCCCLKCVTQFRTRGTPLHQKRRGVFNWLAKI